MQVPWWPAKITTAQSFRKTTGNSFLASDQPVANLCKSTPSSSPYLSVVVFFMCVVARKVAMRSTSPPPSPTYLLVSLMKEGGHEEHKFPSSPFPLPTCCFLVVSLMCVLEAEQVVARRILRYKSREIVSIHAFLSMLQVDHLFLHVYRLKGMVIWHNHTNG